MVLPTLLRPGMFEFPESSDLSIEDKALLGLRPIDAIIHIFNKKLLLRGTENRVYLFRAFTAAGKSTVFPPEIYEQLLQKHSRSLFMAEPRVTLCSNGVNDIRNYHTTWILGNELAIHTGNQRVGSSSRAFIEFGTTQVLQNFLNRIIAELNGNPRKLKSLLRKYLIITIDEAHILEIQTLNVIQTVKRILDKCGDMEECPMFVFASATLDSGSILKYFKLDQVQDLKYIIGTVRGIPNFPIAENYLSEEQVAKFNHQDPGNMKIELSKPVNNEVNEKDEEKEKENENKDEEKGNKEKNENIMENNEIEKHENNQTMNSYANLINENIMEKMENYEIETSFNKVADKVNDMNKVDKVDKTTFVKLLGGTTGTTGTLGIIETNMKTELNQTMNSSPNSSISLTHPTSFDSVVFNHTGNNNDNYNNSLNQLNHSSSGKSHQKHQAKQFHLQSDPMKSPDPFKSIGKLVSRSVLPIVHSSSSTVFIDEFKKSFQCRDVLIFVPGLVMISKVMLEIYFYLLRVCNEIVFKIEQKTTYTELREWRDKNKGKKRYLIMGYSAEFSKLATELLDLPYEVDEDVLLNETKIIISTSVIETGKTLQMLYVCIDSGFDTKNVFSPLCFDYHVMWLRKIPENINQMIQRRGRVGRKSPGIYWAMFSDKALKGFQLNEIPQTVNSGCLSELIYQTQLVHLNFSKRLDIATFNDFIYPIPPDLMIRSCNDLFFGNILGSNGEYLMSNVEERWKIYAKLAYYLLKMSLYRAVMTASINRYKLPACYQVHDFSAQSLPMSIENCIKENYRKATMFIPEGRKLFIEIVEGRSKIIIPYRGDIYDKK